MFGERCPQGTSTASVSPGWGSSGAGPLATVSERKTVTKAELRGKLAAVRASVAGNQQDISRRIALADEAPTYVAGDNLFWRIMPTMDRGLALVGAGEVGAASQALTEAIDLCRIAGHSCCKRNVIHVVSHT